MNQTSPKFPYIYVVGNEKGGAGKTTCSMHLIISLLEMGFKVASIDVDCRQHSLTRYLNNRSEYNKQNPDHQVPIPRHFLITESKKNTIEEREAEEKASFDQALEEAKLSADIIVVDTPGSYSYLSRLAHSYADMVITPVNDSFLDIDVLAKVDPQTLNIITPSIYSQMIWEQKMERAKRDRGSIEWVVVRNRLSNLDAANKRNVAKVLEQLSKRISFRQASGFSERVIFRELFLQGLTLLDLKHPKQGFKISHVAARQELREFLKYINVEELEALRNQTLQEA
jgi:chromosome partitioning protein